MEVLSKSSRICVAPHTQAVDVASSYLSFQDYYLKWVETNVPSDAQTRQLNFSLLPTMSAEMLPSSANIVTEWSVIDKNGAEIPSLEQIGCVQCLGVFAYARCQVRIGGEIFLPTFPMDHHGLFMELVTQVK